VFRALIWRVRHPVATRHCIKMVDAVCSKLVVKVTLSIMMRK
jgi:hypothetical protein